MGKTAGDGGELALFLLGSVHYRKRARPATIRLRSVSRPMLVFVTRGDGALLLDGAAYKLEAGSLFYFAPGMSVETAGAYGEWAYYIVLLDTAVIARRDGALYAAPSLRLPSFLVPGRLIVTDAKRTLKRFERLYVESRSALGSDADRSLLHVRFQELLHAIVDGMEERGKQGGDGGIGIGETIRFMRERFAEKITLATLAGIAGFTPSSYSRAFAKTMGQSPIDYLIGLRISGAKRLLSETGSRVKDVSAAVGFENEFYFSRIFKQQVGIAPALYIKRRKIRVATASCLDYQDNLQSLGYEPVASVNCFRYPWMSDEEYARITAEQMNRLEQVRPELIIGDYFHQPLADRLGDIAPATFLPSESDWRIIHGTIAELVGLEEEGRRTIRGMELREREAARELGHALGNETIIVLQINHRLARIQGTVRHPLNELLYGGLGLKPGANIPNNHFRLELPPERLPSLQADRLFVHRNHLPAGSETVYERMRATSAWNAIKAVRYGQVRHIPNWFRMSWNPPGRSRIIDELLLSVSEQRQPWTNE
ncbi:helix-turn-helix domain-containing protein [Paenibacillus cymbidii]|uniref:helix-turn-helix domain-containing protein n=1 Tax=Paenibacillus cymbidii TaxID=1639034 RepID=UPI00143680FA|nr:AraC family transcriptional regulator [Paenibacillus cymbidii]